MPLLLLFKISQSHHFVYQFKSVISAISPLVWESILSMRLYQWDSVGETRPTVLTQYYWAHLLSYLTKSGPLKIQIELHLAPFGAVRLHLELVWQFRRSHTFMHCCGWNSFSLLNNCSLWLAFNLWLSFRSIRWILRFCRQALTQRLLCDRNFRRWRQSNQLIPL